MRAFTKYDFHSAWTLLCTHDNILDSYEINNRLNVTKRTLINRLMLLRLYSGCGAALGSGSHDSCLISTCFDVFQLTVRFNISQVRL